MCVAYVQRSGLRGAVGLSLSLFVLLDQQISDSRYRTLSFFFMGITAFLTTLIQGTLMTPLLQVTLSRSLYRWSDTTMSQEFKGYCPVPHICLAAFLG